MLRKIFALIKKDFLNEASYKITFIFNSFGVVVSLFSYFYIDKLFGYRMTGYLQEFGVNYFSYALIGIAFFSYVGSGIGSFAGRIQYEQAQGTLESLLLTPTHVYILLVSMGLWNFIFATLDVLIFIVAGVFLFHVNFSYANLLSIAVIMLLTIISFSCLGIFSASFIIIFKKGNPAGWIVNTLEGLLGGVYFPVTVLPPFLQFLAKFLPITYAIRAMQLATYKGYSLSQLKNDVLFLLIFTALLIPLSIISFTMALNKVRRQGSLAQY